MEAIKFLTHNFSVRGARDDGGKNRKGSPSWLSSAGFPSRMRAGGQEEEEQRARHEKDGVREREREGTSARVNDRRAIARERVSSEEEGSVLR